jgi:hypothetical protein
MTGSLRIYREHSLKRARGPHREGRVPVASTPHATTLPAIAVASIAASVAEAPVDTDVGEPTPSNPPVETLPAGFESGLIQIIDARAEPGETLRVHYERKEHELTTALATLTPHDARVLHQRLSRPSPGDALASRFGLLNGERQARLLAFLENAPRRDARASVSR